MKKSAVKTRVVNATEFKAKCSAFLDQVEQNGEPITILRRGRPAAVIGPAKKPVWKSPKNMFVGKMDIVGDIIADTSDTWEVLRDG